MGARRWWKNWRSRRKRARAVAEVPEKRPLREFVYLDEVSLRSLLVSQKDGSSKLTGVWLPSGYLT